MDISVIKKNNPGNLKIYIYVYYTLYEAPFFIIKFNVQLTKKIFF